MSTGNTGSRQFSTNRLSSGRLSLPLTALMAGAALAGVGAMAPLQAQAAGYDAAGQSSSQFKAPAMDLDVVNANLLSVVRALRLQTNAQIVVVSGDYQPVTLTVTASLPDVLHYVAQSAGAVVTRDYNGVYTFRPATAADNSAVSQGDGSAAMLGGDPHAAGSATSAYYAPAAATPAPAQTASEHVEMITVQNVDPNYILKMLGSTEGYRDIDQVNNPVNKPIGPPIDNGFQITTTPFNINVQNDPYATPWAQPASVPMPANNAGGSANQANRSATGNGGDQANQFGFGGGGGGASPFGGAGGAAGGANGLPGQGNGSLRPQGISAIVANEQGNFLIVRGTPEGIAELRQIINFLDRAPKQVQIKVEFVTANVADADSFGISWDLIPFPNVETSFNGLGGTLGAAGSTFLTYAQGNLVAQLQGILHNANSHVVAAPLITTTNNTPGTIDFSSQIPYQTTTTVAQGSGNAISGTTANFLTVTNNLTITPRINGDDSVSMALTPVLTTIGTPTFSGGPPSLSRQRVLTYRTVANGETMVIGGLVQKSTSNARDSVPFLSKLPIIGSLFRTRNLNVSDSELLIFVTPTVLPPIGSGLTGIGSNGMQSGGPGAGDAAGVGVSP